MALEGSSVRLSHDGAGLTLEVDGGTPADLSELFSQEITVCGLLLLQVYRNLQYFVPMPGKHKKDESGKKARLELLKTISGSAVPGQLTALMGGSGAGKVRPPSIATLCSAANPPGSCCAVCSKKLLCWSCWLLWTCCWRKMGKEAAEHVQTTLMDVIAGRKTQGEIRGEILVNGFPKQQESWARVVGYVEQNDIHSPQVGLQQHCINDMVAGITAWCTLHVFATDK